MISINQVTPQLCQGLLRDWWLSHKWEEKTLFFLPPTGLLLSIDNKPIIAGFIYRWDSIHSLVDYFISNPDSTKEERALCFPILLAALEGIARERNSKIMLTWAKHPKLIDKLESFGLKKFDHIMLAKDLY